VGVNSEAVEGDEMYIGTRHNDEENSAGAPLRALLRSTGLCVADSFFFSGPTFWTTKGSRGKRLDHILIPRDALGDVHGCRTFEQSGWRMQLAHTQRKWDHWPLAMTMTVRYVQHRHHRMDAEERPQWDREGMRRCVLFGDKRGDFINKLEALADARNDEFTLAFDNHNTPDEMHAMFIDTVKAAADGTFCSAPAQTTVARSADSLMKSELLKQRRALRDHLGNMAHPGTLESWENIVATYTAAALVARLDHIQWQLTRVSNTLRRNNKNRKLTREEHWTAECNEAYRHGNHKLAWKIGLNAMGTAPGRKYRRHDTLVMAEATDQEWIDRCIAEGPAGGCKGVEIDFVKETDALKKEDPLLTDPRFLRVPTPDHLHTAEALVYLMSKHAPRLRLGKSIVAHSIPNELFRVILRPRWLMKDLRHVGLGMHREFHYPDKIRKWLVFYFAKILATRMTPFLWHLASAFAVGKANGKSGVEGARLVASMCPVGRSFYHILLDYGVSLDDEGHKLTTQGARKMAIERTEEQQLEIHKAADWQFGCIPQRRREEAMLTQMAHAAMLDRLNYFHVTTMYDGTNAFFSAHHEATLEAVQPPFVRGELEHHFLKQRIQYAVMTIGRTSVRHVMLRSGVLPGDHAGPRVFNRVMQQVGSQLLLPIKHRTAEANKLFLKCFLDTEFKVCAAVTNYVDDYAGKAVGSSYQRVNGNKQIMDTAVRTGMRGVGIDMNASKEDTVVCGPHAHAVRLLKLNISRTREDARYLGGRYAGAHSLPVELVYRRAAMKKAWACLWRFFVSNAATRFKIIVFLCCVYNTALAGLEAYAGKRAAVSPQDLHVEQALIHNYLRLLLKGEATIRTTLIGTDGVEHTHYRRRPNVWVERRTRIIPLWLALRIRRLLWLQNMLRVHEHHLLTLFAIFGQIIDQPEPYRPDGAIDPARATPWLVQASQDLMAMEGIDAMASHVQECLLEDGELDVRTLLTDYKEDIVACDPHELQARYLMVTVDLSQDGNDEGEEEDAMLVPGNFTCDLLNDDGAPCGLKFKSLKALHTHQSKTKGDPNLLGGHGWYCKLKELIVDPICPVCLSQFKRRSTAIYHVRKSLQNRRCPTDMSKVVVANVDIMATCKQGVHCTDTDCNYIAESRHHLYQHLVRSHLLLKQDSEPVLALSRAPVVIGGALVSAATAQQQLAGRLEGVLRVRGSRRLADLASDAAQDTSALRKAFRSATVHGAAQAHPTVHSLASASRTASTSSYS